MNSRERTRAEGHSVALSGTFRETLTRHAGLLKQAAAFRARPDDFASLLAQRGGIGRKDLDAFEELHARARRHRRAVYDAARASDQAGGGTTEGRAGDAAGRNRGRHTSRAHPTGPAAPRQRAIPGSSRNAEHTTRCCGRKRRGTREAVLVCALHGITPGLERLHRRRPASWYSLYFTPRGMRT